MCTYPHTYVYTERTGLRESGVNAVGFLKGRKKGTEKSHGMSLDEVMPSGDRRNDDKRGSLGRGSAPG